MAKEAGDGKIRARRPQAVYDFGGWGIRVPDLHIFR